MTPAQVQYWEEQLAALAATDEWKKQLEDNYLTGQFLKAADSSRFLRGQYDLLKSILGELGMAKQ